MNALIAIVEDDPDQARNYSDALEHRGFQVSSYSSRIQAIEGFRKDPPDVAILDVVLGSEFDGGFDLFKNIQEFIPDLPVIFLSSRADEIDQVFGLRLGAWDYQTKPVSLTLLAERVSVLLKIKEARTVDQPPSRDQQIQHGNLRIDTKRMLVSWKEEALVFTVTECSLLTAIVKANGGAVRYDELAAITKQTIVTNNTINTHIRHIRQKFRLIDPHFDSITNVYGAGYRWTAD
ncbi:MAG: response regulator [Methylococcales bacterium]|nr:response regulator [Methylococcales bacterium]